MAQELGTLVAKIAADITDLKSGLKQGQAELAGFRELATKAGDTIKSALAFTGITAGLIGVASKLREFGQSAMEAGKNLEVLRLSMYQIGSHYQMSASSLDFYLAKLKEMGILQENAVKAVNAFMKTGISIDYLPALAQAAKDLAPSMAMTTNEAFEAITGSIATGLPRALRQIIPGIQQVMQASASETKKLVDESVLSVSERSQIMADYVLKFADKVKGVGAAAADSYMSQLSKYKRAVAEAKEAMFELYKPIATAVLGQQIQNWQQFLEAINNNREAIRQFGEAIGVLIGRVTSGIRTIVEFIATHKDLTLAILTVYSASKALTFAAMITGALAARTAVIGLSGVLGTLRAMIASPWTLVIIASLVGMDLVARQLRALNAPIQAKVREEKGAMMVAPPKTDLGMREMTPEEAKAFEAAPIDQESVKRAQEAQAKEEAARAAKIGAAENVLPQTGKGGKGGGKGGKGGKEEDLFGEHLRVLEAQRAADLQAASASVDLLKATNEKKKAEMEKALAEGTLDGREYYDGLQNMAQAETTAALNLIKIKQDAARKAYDDALADIERQDASEEMKEMRRQEELSRYRVTQSQLNAEAAKTRLEGEIKVTNELKRQFEVSKEWQAKLTDMKLENALGPIEEQEARLQRLVIEWAKTKEEAIKAGVSPEIIGGMEAEVEKKKFATKYGDQINNLAGDIANGVSSLMSALTEGGQNLMSTAHNVFQSIFNDALKPGLDKLKDLLVRGFKELFGSVGGEAAGAIMGAIGLVGMLLTSGGGKSSFSSSGVSSGVTAHQAVRGIVAGDTSLPIAQIQTSLQEVMAPHLMELRQISANTARLGTGGGASLSLTVQGLSESLKATLDDYFRDYLLTEVR